MIRLVKCASCICSGQRVPLPDAAAAPPTTAKYTKPKGESHRTIITHCTKLIMNRKWRHNAVFCLYIDQPTKPQGEEYYNIYTYWVICTIIVFFKTNNFMINYPRRAWAATDIVVRWFVYLFVTSKSTHLDAISLRLQHS